MYILKILRCLWLARCILICCSSVSLLFVCGVFNSVKIMSFFMYCIVCMYVFYVFYVHKKYGRCLVHERQFSCHL